MLWQSAYSEYDFVDTLWPDFTPGMFEKALEPFPNAPENSAAFLHDGGWGLERSLPRLGTAIILACVAAGADYRGHGICRLSFDRGCVNALGVGANA